MQIWNPEISVSEAIPLLDNTGTSRAFSAKDFWFPDQRAACAARVRNDWIFACRVVSAENVRERESALHLETSKPTG